MLNVSFHGNEILNFNRGINRVFHSHSFSTSHAKLLVFLRILRRVPPSVSNERSRPARVESRTNTIAFPSRGNETTKRGIRFQLEGMGDGWEQHVPGTMERRENFGHLSCLY